MSNVEIYEFKTQIVHGQRITHTRYTQTQPKNAPETGKKQKQIGMEGQKSTINQTVTYGTSVCALSNDSPFFLLFILLAIKSRSTITANTAIDAGKFRAPLCTCSETPSPLNIKRITPSSPSD